MCAVALIDLLHILLAFVSIYYRHEYIIGHQKSLQNQL